MADNMYEDKEAKGLPKMSKKSNRELLATVKERYTVMYDADHENRLAAMEDMKFVNVPGWQWDDNMKQERGKRPCYEFNKIRVTSKRIINDMRANRPGVKIRATEDGDKEGAELREGTVRNIWAMSKGNNIMDYAAEYQVNGGMGAWRVNTAYRNDRSFDKDICVQGIENPFTLFWDPSAKDYMKRDADDWILTTKISLAEYEETYPGAAKDDFQQDMNFDNDEEWQNEETIRLGEYWYKETIDKTLIKIIMPPKAQPQIVDLDTDEGAAIMAMQEAGELAPAEILETRTFKGKQIKYCTVSGSRVLDGPHDWPGHNFPFVVVFGEHINIDGRPYWWGLPRFAKDAQRSYNVSRTAITETIAQAPKTQWWATPEQARGLEALWAEAHKKNLPYMLYNPDPKAGGPPERMGGADVPVALIQEAQLASDEIKAVTGIYDASMGARSNETSGRAIFARQHEGEIATYNFQDNMEKAIERTYEIIMDLVPEVYDTERELRLLGEDGTESYKKINSFAMGEDGLPVRVNDLSEGEYDISLTTGPSFSTRRQEASEIYSQLVGQMPEIMQVAGDLVFKAMDLPYSEEMADRLSVLLPPEVQALKNEDTEIPPEVQQMMAQAEQATEQAQMMMQEAEAAKAEADKAVGQAKLAGADVAVKSAEQSTEKAEFDKHMAQQFANLYKMQAQIAKAQADMAPGIAQHDEYQDAAAQVGEAKETLQRIDGLMANFIKMVDTTVDSLEQRVDKKIVGGETTREDGALVARVVYDDGSERTIKTRRGEDGKLSIEPESDAETEADLPPGS
jgi:hypothetical protein